MSKESTQVNQESPNTSVAKAGDKQLASGTSADAANASQEERPAENTTGPKVHARQSAEEKLKDEIRAQKLSQQGRKFFRAEDVGAKSELPEASEFEDAVTPEELLCKACAIGNYTEV